MAIVASLGVVVIAIGAMTRVKTKTTFTTALEVEEALATPVVGFVTDSGDSIIRAPHVRRQEVGATGLNSTMPPGRVELHGAGSRT